MDTSLHCLGCCCRCLWRSSPIPGSSSAGCWFWLLENCRTTYYNQGPTRETQIRLGDWICLLPQKVKNSMYIYIYYNIMSIPYPQNKFHSARIYIYMIWQSDRSSIQTEIYRSGKWDWWSGICALVGGKCLKTWQSYLQVFSRTSFEKQLSENLQSCAAEPSSAAASRTATCSSSHCGKCVFALCRKKALHPRRRENNQTFNLSSGFIFHVKGRRTSGEMNVKPRPKKKTFGKKRIQELWGNEPLEHQPVGLWSNHPRGNVLLRYSQVCAHRVAFRNGKIQQLTGQIHVLEYQLPIVMGYHIRHQRG